VLSREPYWEGGRELRYRGKTYTQSNEKSTSRGADILDRPSHLKGLGQKKERQLPGDEEPTLIKRKDQKEFFIGGGKRAKRNRLRGNL